MDATGVDAGDTSATSAVCAAYRATRTTDTTFAPVKASEKDRNPLAAQLAMVIKAVRAGVPSRVYMVQLGGFDTRADERETQQRLLQPFDEAVATFLRDMSADRYGKNVVLLAYSEFGRRVAANASKAPIMAPPGRCSSPGHHQGRVLRRGTQPHGPRQRRPQTQWTFATSSTTCWRTPSRPIPHRRSGRPDQRGFPGLNPIARLLLEPRPPLSPV